MGEAKPTVNTDRLKFLPFIKFCIIFDLSSVVLTFFQWDLIDYLTPFFLPVLLLLAWAILAILTFTSIIFIPFQFKNVHWKSFIPLIVNVITILILYFVPFNSLWLDLQFRMNKSGYEKVIEMYENGKLNQPSKSGYIELPFGYRRFSKGGGDIIVDNSDGVTSVFFYTYRGIGNSSGFIYRSNNIPPPQFLMQRDCYQLEQIEPKWFFCASD